ncbi:hypothetical protein DPMN_167930 [Dreissena polymorpha]|uniref:Uncharacterized protein n=1 Tax=Dreissena polymorpha TaxID=45954 RepID=A0A9D4F143_DREPO|nr:hypothetical protein DPMN_167930 [Dreissena polymorpha]
MEHSLMIQRPVIHHGTFNNDKATCYTTLEHSLMIQRPCYTALEDSRMIQRPVIPPSNIPL